MSSNVIDFDAQCVLHTGSRISLVSRAFAVKHRIPTVEWKGPPAAVAVGRLLNSPLGTDYLCKTPFLIDFKIMQAVYPKVNLAVPFSLKNCEITYNFSDVNPLSEGCFPFKPCFSSESQPTRSYKTLDAHVEPSLEGTVVTRDSAHPAAHTTDSTKLITYEKFVEASNIDPNNSSFYKRFTQDFRLFFFASTYSVDWQEKSEALILKPKTV